jgi:glycerate dehydrogenase
MKIVVLDGYTMNPGDLSWSQLEKLGRLTVHDRTPPELTIKRAAAAEIVLTNKTVLSDKTIQKLPNLKYIGVLATGYNVVDIAAAAQKGIVVTNVPAYSTNSVAQMVFAHILNITLRVADHSKTARDGKWTKCPDFAYWDYPLTELAGLNMGIVGFGQTGKAVAKLALAFNMNTLVHTRTVPDPQPDGIQFVDLETLFKQSDCLSLHCPLTELTQNLVNKDHLALMKQSAILINTSRGPVVNEQNLADALNSEQIAAAALDVLSTEPPKPDNPLLTAKNCFITPHIAWATVAARKRLMKTVTENCKAFIQHRPQNVITPSS